MKTAVIYARYSSNSQTEQSIEGQLRVCYEYAKNNNITVIAEYIDRATTGTNDNRESFQKMIKDSNKQAWDIVLVYKLDRFSRNKFESTIFAFQFIKHHSPSLPIIISVNIIRIPILVRCFCLLLPLLFTTYPRALPQA